MSLYVEVMKFGLRIATVSVRRLPGAKRSGISLAAYEINDIPAGKKVRDVTDYESGASDMAVLARVIGHYNSQRPTESL